MTENTDDNVVVLVEGTPEDEIVAELQEREGVIWEELAKTCTLDTLQLVGELIEINIELEAHCNK